MDLVTGGGGFIGSHLVERLVRAGRTVRVFDDFSTGSRENLRQVLEEVEIVTGDVTDDEAIHGALEGVEVVYHQAALPSVPRSIAEPRKSLATNTMGTLNVLLAARDAGCRRVVFASSSSVYGDTEVMPKVETVPTRPLSPYAISKLSGEQLCAVFFKLFGLETISLRYFNVFGPRQDPKSEYAAVIPKFISMLGAGERPVVYGDGEQSRDFTYVDNVVDANIGAGTCESGSGQAFNIATGSAVTINSMLAMIRDVLGVELDAKYESARPGDVRHSLADISAAQASIGYQPRVSFQEGLKRTITSIS